MRTTAFLLALALLCGLTFGLHDPMRRHGPGGCCPLAAEQLSP